MARQKKTADMRAALLYFLVVIVLLAAIGFMLVELFGGGAPVEDGVVAAAQSPAPTEQASGAPALTFAPSPTPSASPTPKPSPTPRAATIRAVGDLMMHQKQLTDARRSGGTYDFLPQYALIQASIQSADYAIANLETTVGKVGDKAHSGYPRFNAPVELLDAVKESGFDFLTLANNHILDRNYTGMIQTINLVESYGFDFAGANRSAQEKAAPKIVEVNNIRIGMLCYTQGTNGMEKQSDARAAEFGVNYLRKADFEADVQNLREAGAEVVIAMPHWGSEYRRSPSSYQKYMAKRMALAGVDVILGSHPHVVQPAGILSGVDSAGNERDVLVAFSLGNFNSGMSASYTDSGIILEFTLTEQPDGAFAIENVGYVPTYCWRQRSVNQTLSSAEYYRNPPKGMDARRIRKMRESL